MNMYGHDHDFLPPLVVTGLIQILLLIFYYKNRKKEEAHLFENWFPTRLHFLVTSLAVVFTCYIWNISEQIYCVPVPWVQKVIFGFLFLFLSYPFLPKDSKPVLFFYGLMGGGLFIFLFLIFFLPIWGGLYVAIVGMYLVFTSPLTIAAFSLNRWKGTRFWDALKYPAAFLLMPITGMAALFHIVSKQENKTFRCIFFATPIAMILFCTYTTWQLSNIYDTVTAEDFVVEEAYQYTKNPLDRHLLELALGAHWKYHTEMDPTDGERPPYNDPILGVAHLFVKTPGSWWDRAGYLVFPEAKNVYKTLFPENKTSFDCACAKYDPDSRYRLVQKKLKETGRLESYKRRTFFGFFW